MPKYEVYIKPEFRFQVIEAQSDVAARTLASNQMRAFLEADHFESCNLETDDGKDKQK